MNFTKRRTNTNKTPRICFVIIMIFVVYYTLSQLSDVKFQGMIRGSDQGDCRNLGCVEFPVHQNSLHMLMENESSKALEMCTKTFWHTLATTIKKTEQDDYFVFTGDIPHMWLRDSAAQVHGYIDYAKDDESMNTLIAGVINRSAFYINYDPYGNAFSLLDEGKRSQVNCEGCYGHVAEWKYELDSTCYFIRLIYTYWYTVQDSSILEKPQILSAVKRILEMWIVEQNHHNNSTLNDYINPAINSSLYRNRGYYNELKGEGRGTPVKYTGMIWSGYRPSDDACVYGYLIPSNMFASKVLTYVKTLSKELWKDTDLFETANKLKNEIDQGIKKYGTVTKGDMFEKYGEIYAYEVDGLGNQLLLDDANVPSLLSIPYLGFHYDEEIYHNTRSFILSTDNPSYFVSRDGKFKGIGSLKHTGPGNIWPMSQLMQALTSKDQNEKVDLLQQILRSDANTNWMHESYNADNPKSFTRSWFCWADALFAELVQSMTDINCRGKRPIIPGLNL